MKGTRFCWACGKYILLKYWTHNQIRKQPCDNCKKEREE
jgi:hypothetical protein